MITSKGETWERAQEEELHCWSSLKEKLNSKSYFHSKCEYWKKILLKSSLSPDELTKFPSLEVGCGPTGIFMLIKSSSEKSNYHVLDPLLNDYRKIVPYLEGFSGFNSTLEEAEISPRQYQRIFAINCIDHCKDIKQFCLSLSKLTHENGTVYLAVNTHKRNATAKIWRLFQFLLEPLHPYHFTENEYQKLLSRFFSVEQIVDIEDEVIAVNNQTRDHDHRPANFWKAFKKSIKKSLEYFSLRNAIFRSLECFGIPAHDYNSLGDSIYKHKLFVLKPHR